MVLVIHHTLPAKGKRPTKSFRSPLPIRTVNDLRRERRWVRSSSFRGEFNGALVAPYNSAE